MLSGVLVLDLSRLLPGPFATMQLAAMGATVVKVEDTMMGDYTRSLFQGSYDMSPLFHMLNQDKKSICLDLRTPKGKEVLTELAKKADIVVESFRPGVVDRLGIGYKYLSSINRRIVYCSITGYGQTGPWSKKAGHDINYVSMSGILDQIGPKDGPPVVPNFQIADLCGGAQTASTFILAALFQATRTGSGEYLDVSMTDSTFTHGVFPLGMKQVIDSVEKRSDGVISGGIPCYGVYETKDNKYMAVGALEEKFWNVLCDTLSIPELKGKGAARGEEGERVRSVVARIFKGRTRDEWSTMFDKVDCCVTPVLNFEEAGQHPQLRSKRLIREVMDRRGEPVSIFSVPVKFSSTDNECGKSSEAPHQGEHTEEVLSLFGLSLK